MPVGPALIVVNPRASKVREPAARRRLVSALQRSLAGGTGPPIVVTTGDSREIAHAVQAALADGIGRAVAVGGDGTVMTVAGALRGSGVPLGIVPAGTGNLLAGSLGIPGRLREAIAALPGEVPRTLDLGLACWTAADPAHAPAAISRPFGVACGSGFDARLMAATHAEHKRRYGRAAYFVTAVALARELRPVTFCVEVDGRPRQVEAAVVLAANSGELVPGWLGPRLPVDPDDGLLDLFVLQAGGPVGGLRGVGELLARGRLGDLPSGLGFRVRGRRVRIAGQPAQPVQVDGDPLGAGTLEATVEPGGLTILVPPGSS